MVNLWKNKYLDGVVESIAAIMVIDGVGSSQLMIEVSHTLHKNEAYIEKYDMAIIQPKA